MNIIQLTATETGSRSAIQSWDGIVPPNGYAKVSSECDTSAMQTYNGHVNITQDENGEVVSITGNEEAYQKYLDSLVPDIEKALEETKSSMVQKSKDDLEVFLANNPITWVDGKKYSITREKQQQLTSKILSATLAAQTQMEYNLTWNSTGEECVPWELSDLASLAFAIDRRVTSLVSYQQKKEIEITKAQSLSELEAIEVDYSSVPLEEPETDEEVSEEVSDEVTTES